MKKYLLIALLTFISMITVQTTGKASEYADRSGRTIFEGATDLKSSDKITVEKVVVVQETDYSLILDVFYTIHSAPSNFLQKIKENDFQDEVPAKELQLFVLPNMPYWASNSARVEKGRHVARVSIDLYDKKMQEDKVSQVESSKLTVSFDHYAPEKFNGSIHSEIIPFKKIWKNSQLKK